MKLHQHPARQPITCNTGKPTIECGYSHVIICGQAVQRPDSISPKQWMDFWERLIARELS
jgi:hypothetical protein